MKLILNNPFQVLWEGISNNGIDSPENLKKTKLVILTNQISVTAAVLAIPHIFYYYFTGLEFASIIQLITAALFISPFILNKVRLYSTAKILLVSFASLNVFLTSSMLGRESGEQLAYYAIVLGVFILFEGNNVLILLITLIPILCLVVLELTDYTPIVLPHVIAKPHQYTVNFLATLFLLIIIVYYYRRISGKEIIDVLKNAKAQLEAIFNNSLDAILLLNIENFTILDCNVRAVELFDAQDKDHILRNNINSLSHQPHSKKQIHDIKKGLIKNNKWSGEYELQTIKGKLFWGDVAITTIKMDDFNRLLVRITDISEKKLAEEKIAHTLIELKNRNHELDNFVYSTSHDLRAPIASILGLVNISKFENQVETLRNYFKLIEQSSMRLDKVISTILEYSKAVNAPVKVAKVSIVDLINHSYEDLKFFNNADRLDVQIEMEQSAILYSDEFRIMTIIKNIVSNAIKYLNTDCDHNFLKFEIKVDKKTVEIVASDNGVGIEKSNQPQIFEMFFRGTHKFSGSGLGLYITKLNVEKLHGTIAFESTYGEGTKFIISFPNAADAYTYGVKYLATD